MAGENLTLWERKRLANFHMAKCVPEDNASETLCFSSDADMPKSLGSRTRAFPVPEWSLYDRAVRGELEAEMARITEL
jgi:hypothetical protein